MQKQQVNLGALSWNPARWFQPGTWTWAPWYKPQTAVIKTAAGGTITVPVTGVVPPGYIPSDITSPEYRARTEYIPGRGLAPVGATAGTTTGSWWEPFMTTAERIISTWTNYQASASQSEKDRLALQLQYDLQLAAIEAGKPPATITLPWMKEPIPVDWASIAKATLLVGGIGLGVYLVAKK